MKLVICFLVLFINLISYSSTSFIAFEPLGIQYINMHKTHFYKEKVDSIVSNTESKFPSDELELFSLPTKIFELTDSLIRLNHLNTDVNNCNDFGSMRISHTNESGQELFIIYLCGADRTIGFLNNLIIQFKQYDWASTIVSTSQYYIDMINDQKYLDKK